ncbi:recombinase family protein [Burkholderia seminalis]|uniref:recombinase family protein n=1 Tax=Burkholderia seminalis TaxID=488731 RepID=UPI00299D2F83|nr:recombinase family protein [Burkholderia seminalis]
MRIGYARVSTDEQNLDLQWNALQAYGCDDVVTDRGISGARFDRPGLQTVLARLESGDTLVVWRLDRLGRSLSELVKLMAELRERGIQFASLQEAIDTGSPAGMFMFHMIAALAEFERSLISERTRAGLAAARRRGSRLGRPAALNDEQLEQARQWLSMASIEEVADRLEIHPRTLQRYLRLQEEPPSPEPAECSRVHVPEQPGAVDGAQCEAASCLRDPQSSEPEAKAGCGTWAEDDTREAGESGTADSATRSIECRVDTSCSKNRLILSITNRLDMVPGNTPDGGESQLCSGAWTSNTGRIRSPPEP